MDTEALISGRSWALLRRELLEYLKQDKRETDQIIIIIRRIIPGTRKQLIIVQAVALLKQLKITNDLFQVIQNKQIKIDNRKNQYNLWARTRGQLSSDKSNNVINKYVKHCSTCVNE